MKKTLITLTLVGALISGYNVYKSQNEKDFSTAALANVEALASNEATSKDYNCYSILKGEGKSISCATCQMEDGTPPWYHMGDT